MSFGDIGKGLVQSSRKAPAAAGGVLRKVLDLAIDGYTGLPGARDAAKTQLTKHGHRDEAIDGLIKQHIGLAGAQGFVTNIGGLATLAISIPANLTGIAVIQTRLVASIAHLRGYDLDDGRVRSAILMCLLGKDTAERLVASGDLPSTPMAIATAPVFDAELDAQISQRVLGVLLTQVGGKKAGLLFAKRIPLIGGGIGAATDSFTALTIARYAEEQFVDRRRA